MRFIFWLLGSEVDEIAVVNQFSKLAFAKLRPKPCPRSISSPASSPTNSLVVASDCWSEEKN